MESLRPRFSAFPGDHPIAPIMFIIMPFMYIRGRITIARRFP
jgi:hypothetical protein